MESEDLLGLITIIVIVISIITLIFYFNIITPLRDLNAQNSCEDLGFETFIKYNNIIFQTKPVALVCGTMEQRLINEGKIKAYSTNGDGNIIVQEIKG